MRQKVSPQKLTKKEMEKIGKKILLMGKQDQKARKLYLTDKSTKTKRKLSLIDTSNRKEFKAIFKKVGYISSKYGKEVQFSAFLIVQHMPKSEVRFMKNYLSLMKDDWGGIDPNNYAQLCDRVETWQNKPQIYGTQFIPVEGKENTYQLKDLYEPHDVDKRRLEIGLGTLKSYIRKLSKERGVTLIF